ncbi:MAG: NUDIX hydrolase [Terriglobales bacterium]
MESKTTPGELLAPHTLPSLADQPWHFTASAVVIAAGHILLVHHKRIGAWLPPGGHFIGNELPHQAAVREALEETGVAVEVVTESVPPSDDPEAFFCHQPLCIHGVHAVEKGNAVYHLDIAYLCLPAQMTEGEALPPITTTDEVHAAVWCPLDRLEDLPLARNVPEIVALALEKLGSQELK